MGSDGGRGGSRTPGGGARLPDSTGFRATRRGTPGAGRPAQSLRTRLGSLSQPRQSSSFPRYFFRPWLHSRVGSRTAGSSWPSAPRAPGLGEVSLRWVCVCVFWGGGGWAVEEPESPRGLPAWCSVPERPARRARRRALLPRPAPMLLGSPPCELPGDTGTSDSLAHGNEGQKKTRIRGPPRRLPRSGSSLQAHLGPGDRAPGCRGA